MVFSGFFSSWTFQLKLNGLRPRISTWDPLSHLDSQGPRWRMTPYQWYCVWEGRALAHEAVKTLDEGNLSTWQDLCRSCRNLKFGEGLLIYESHSCSAQFPASPGPFEQQSALQYIPLPRLVSAETSLSPLEETRSSTGPRAGLRDNASSWLPAGFCTAGHTSFSLVARPIFHPTYCPLIQPTSHQSDDKDTMADCTQSLAKVKAYNIHCPLLAQGANHHVKESRFLQAQAWFNLDASSASFALHSLHPPGCGVSGDQIHPVSLPPLELTYLQHVLMLLQKQLNLVLSDRVTNIPSNYPNHLYSGRKYRWWHSRWNNYVVESCSIYVKGYYTRAPNVSKITPSKQHAGFARLFPSLIMLAHVYGQTYMGFYC